MVEIERKWILHELPQGCYEQKPIPYERHFLFVKNGIEIRVQKKADKYEFERKIEQNALTREGQKFEITKDEFEYFCQKSMTSLVRQSYLIHEAGWEVSIKEYLGKHKGLIRAEIEFSSTQEAESFVPLAWFGEEITD